MSARLPIEARRARGRGPYEAESYLVSVARRSKRNGPRTSGRNQEMVWPYPQVVPCRLDVKAWPKAPRKWPFLQKFRGVRARRPARDPAAEITRSASSWKLSVCPRRSAEVLHQTPPLTNLHPRYKNYTVSFEFDARKSAANQRKHGIDFVDAQALWDDPDFLEIPARTVEPRFIVIGVVKNKHWTGIITYRGENIRIISVRRSRSEEVAIYES